MFRFLLVALGTMYGSAILLADGPADNRPEQVRRVPPPGLGLADEERAVLRAGADALGERLREISSSLSNRPALRHHWPDAAIYHKAVDWALRYNEVYRTNETAVARRLLEQGNERINALQAGQAPWTTATGLVVRAYRSRIDDSIQPYGLVVPPSYHPQSPHRYRLDFWFHGRGEQLTELDFIQGRQRSAGEFTPEGTIVAHLYGRYCNANKFAGEMDLFEAWEHIRGNYPIDPDRVVVRGFSMGGAACWQFAVHYAGLWAAAAPGAGFSETPEFLRVFQNETVQPAAFERKLWHWYDCPDYALNLFHCPTVAYSGAMDRQKQAADIMAQAMAREGLDLVHIIGPDTGHKYHPESKREIDRRVDAVVARGRERVPDRVRLVTWTLRYHEMKWVRIDQLGEHWAEARVAADMDRALQRIALTTTNVTALTLSMEPGDCPLDPLRTVQVVVDGTALTAPRPRSDRSWQVSLTRAGSAWSVASDPALADGVRKRHGLQGPIDDAFMERFLMVAPSGVPLNPRVGGWVEAEMTRAADHWRRQFRGDARTKKDVEVTDADLADSHLVLWGDPNSNAVLKRLASKLPWRWDGVGVHTGEAIYPADRYVPMLIYPNPLNPKRYVVLNSGFTFRDYDYLNNARQVAKLPDYAVIDMNVPPSTRAPGGITLAGFFDEYWRWQKP